MFCPNCGNTNSKEQKFCRSCGLGLEKVALSLTEQIPTKATKSLAEQKQKLEELGFVALSVFGLSVVSFLLYHLFTKVSVTQGNFVAALIVLAVAIVVGCGLASVILFAKANELKESPAQRELADNPVNTTGKLLEAHQQPTFGVTEGTTELLKVEVPRKSADS